MQYVNMYFVPTAPFSIIINFNIYVCETIHMHMNVCNVQQANTSELQTSLFVKFGKIKNAFYALDAT